MKRTTITVMLGSHLLALGIGVWMAISGGESAVGPEQDEQEEADGRTYERGSRSRRSGASEHLIAAYGDSQYWSEARRRRQKGGSTETESPPHVPYEERASGVKDIAAALEVEASLVNAGKEYDYRLCRALITRWVKEDPAACAAWLGRLKTRGGWGDPFSAFADAAAATELLAWMDESWLEDNRRSALKYLAGKVGESEAEMLPDVLGMLSENEAEVFVTRALENARAEDVAVWLEILDPADSDAFQKLAMRWMKGPAYGWAWRDGTLVPGRGESADWDEKAADLLEAVQGTAAEDIFRKRWETARRNTEEGRLQLLMERDPVAAVEGLLELRREAGASEEDARVSVEKSLESTGFRAIREWRRREWEDGLQAGVLGERVTMEVVRERLDLIEAELPGFLQRPMYKNALADAVLLEPAATIELAVERGWEGLIGERMPGLISSPEVPRSTRTEILVAAYGSGRDRELGVKESSVVGFLRQDFRDYSGEAEIWLEGLPPELVDKARKEVAK